MDPILLPRPAQPAHRAPTASLDQVSKRILASVSDSAALDVAAIARLAGASEDVVRHRLASLQEAGVLRGIHLRIDPAALGERYECLVSGVPTAQTDRQAIDRLCASAGVTRVFGMASRHSVAFTVRGGDRSRTHERGLELARQAGLTQAQAVLIVNTFHDEAGLAWGAGELAAGSLS